MTTRRVSFLFLMSLFAFVLSLVALSLTYGDWQVVENTDLMTDTVKVSVAAFADISTGTLQTPLIVFRRDGARVEAFVAWGGYSMEYEPCLIRFGSASAVRWGVSGLSTDDEATFFANVPGFVARIRNLQPTDTLTIAANRATGVQSIARWSVADLAVLLDTHVKVPEENATF